MTNVTMPTDVLRGKDFGEIPWVDYDGHRWHYWKPLGGWGHFPHHCPACSRRIYGDLGPLVNTDTHLDHAGHRLWWSGATYEHVTERCEECHAPTDLSQYPPGARPPADTLEDRP